jgi:hypothetical protein
MISDSSCQLIDVVTGIHGPASIDELITVSPNPANQFITLTNAGLNIQSIHLLNIVGNELMEIKENLTEQNGVIKLSLPALSSGVYLLNIETDRGIVTRKINISNE